MEFEELQEQEKEAQKAVSQKTAAASGDGMTLLERFQRVMHYQTYDKLPNFEFGYWNDTLKDWHSQGLPESVTDEKTAYEYFGIENYHVLGVGCGLGGAKVFQWEKLEETDEKVIIRDWLGVVTETLKEGHQSIPHYLEYPIRDRESWKPFKEYLLNNEKGLPENWDEIVKNARRRDYPLGIQFGSLIGTARNLIGFDNTALLVYEDPELMADIVDTFCQNSIMKIEKALPHIQLDFAAGWEDICFNSGPIVGVPFFNEVLAPAYKRITDLLNLHGVDIIQTDCDGNISQVVPAFLEGGVNTMFPVEVHGGSDPVALRKEHGRQLRFWGGVDKMIFLKDKKAIDDELERLRPVVEEGGFIPTVDHRVQADAKLDLYKHYLDKKRELFNAGGEPKY
ncbi:MAG: hypothetical protein ACLFUS_06750 [Candidatus Sumerlaeia bacterium]